MAAAATPAKPAKPAKKKFSSSGLMASTSAGRRSRPPFCLEHWQSSCHDLLWGAQAGPANAIRQTYRKVAD